MKMKTKTIRKEDIPEWELGDVVIKKFSFGDKIRLAGMSQDISVKGKEVVVSNNAKLDAYAISIYTVASGVHSIKKSDNYEFLIPPHSHVDDKLLVVSNDDFSYEAGEFLMNEIKDLNKAVSEEEKKKS